MKSYEIISRKNIFILIYIQIRMIQTQTKILATKQRRHSGTLHRNQNDKRKWQKSTKQTQNNSDTKRVLENRFNSIFTISIYSYDSY